jgi:hypothetical protein
MSRNGHSKTRRNQRLTGKQQSGRRTMQGRTSPGTQSSQITRARSQEPTSMESGAIPSSMSSMTGSAMESARKSFESISSSALSLANSALKTVKENPVPFALAGAGVVCAGAGITWLLLSSAKSAAASEGASSQSSMPSMKQAKKTMKRAGEKASQLAHDALEGGKKLETSVEDVVREHPIAVGAALLATGAAIGLAMPRTALEDTWLGRERDHLVSSAKSLAQGAVKQVESMAKQVAGKASNNNIAHA